MDRSTSTDRTDLEIEEASGAQEDLTVETLGALPACRQDLGMDPAAGNLEVILGTL